MSKKIVTREQFRRIEGGLKHDGSGAVFYLHERVPTIGPRYWGKADPTIPGSNGWEPRELLDMANQILCGTKVKQHW
jgi:hypothetical protein